MGMKMINIHSRLQHSQVKILVRCKLRSDVYVGMNIIAVTQTSQPGSRFGCEKSIPMQHAHTFKTKFVEKCMIT